MENNNFGYNKDLSICIPTYNRASKLRESISLMIEKVMGYNICFFISDNGSTDDTEKVIDELKIIYPYIIYSKNPYNLGYDRNLEIVLKLSDTRYKWIFGDDDMIEEDNIKNIMSELNKEYTSIVLNRSTVHGPSITQPKIYFDANELLAERGGHMTYISTLIIRKDFTDNKNLFKYYGSNFMQTGLIFEHYNIHACKVLCIPSVNVKAIKSAEPTYLNKIFEIFFIDFFNALCLLPEKYKLESKHKCIRKNMSDFIISIVAIVFMRATGQLKVTKTIKHLPEIKIALSYRHRIMYFIILVLPRVVSKVGWEIIKKLKSHSNNV